MPTGADAAAAACSVGFGEHLLQAVPAVHFRLAFAERVNQLCSDPETLPDAIAVELGPDTASAAWAWLKELHEDPAHRSLPCMLGITHTNDRIRPSMRDRALRLQEAIGRDLSDLPPESLKQLLGFSAMRVLYLSPTDSIIEAIRCAIALQVPLYGVDLDATASREPKDTMLQDPLMASGEVDRYVQRNGRFADAQRDEEIDARRELAMAARLKTIAQQHRRVLFTGGLAHWNRLHELLMDPTVGPVPQALAVSEVTPEGFQRVLVSPLLAIYHMDVFPAAAEAYERSRVTGRSGSSSFATVDIPARFSALLRQAGQLRFSSAERKEQLDRLLEDWEAYRQFEQFLTNLCQLKQRLVPDIFTALLASQSIMSPAFSEMLAAELMKFDWATPEQFRGLPILAPKSVVAGDAIRGELVDSDGRRRRGVFFIDPLPGRGSYTVKVPIPWRWLREPYPPMERSVSGYLEEWRPLSNLITALSLQAMAVTQGERVRARSEPFAGSLLDGVDIKGTLRSATRGENRVFVRDGVMRRRRRSSDEHNLWDPVVWIFRLDTEGKARWVPLHDWIRPLLSDLATDKARVESIARTGLTGLVHGLCYATSTTAPELSIPGNTITRVDYRGLVLYQPFCFSPQQTIWWAEETDFARHPVAELEAWNSPRIGGLVAMFRERHAIDLDEFDWPTTLVRMAIPYAQSTVTVVAPDGLELASIVQYEANKKGIELHRAPLSYFDRELVKRGSQMLASSIEGRDEHDEPIFPQYLIRRLGEQPTAYQDWVPKRIREYAARGTAR